MKPLSKAAQLVQPSPIRRMFNLAAGMQDVVSFTVGEPDSQTPAHIVRAAVDALRRGEHHYTPNAGILPLRQAISAAAVRQQGLRYDPQTEVMVTAGGMEALMLAMLTLLNPGEEWLLPDPCWTNYSRQVQLCSAQPRFVPVRAEDGFFFDPEALEAAVTPQTKGFLINSPANPTGCVAARAQLEALAALAAKYDLWVISDEVYRELVYDGAEAGSIAALPGMRERTLVVNSFSKTYAMTGWRVGYALGPAEVVGNMVKLQENVAACVNSSAQYGALAALQGPQEPKEEMRRSYAARRKLILQAFSEIPGLRADAPQGTFYLFVDISATGMDAEQFAGDLLEKEHVVVVPGEAFGEGGRRYVRLSFAASEQTIREGSRRIARYMKNLGF